MRPSEYAPSPRAPARGPFYAPTRYQLRHPGGRRPGYRLCRPTAPSFRGEHLSPAEWSESPGVAIQLFTTAAGAVPGDQKASIAAAMDSRHTSLSEGMSSAGRARIGERYQELDPSG